MTAPPESLVQYVPVLVAQRYANGAAPALAPSTEGFSGAALFADITGFTALAEQLARRGPVGAEELGDLLNRYFRQLIALIEAHGGDVVKFAGDGLLAVWNAGADGGDLALTALRAIQCGLEIQHRLDYHAVTPEVQLRQRVTVGAGDMRLAQLGGELGRWELLISGAPLGQLSVAQNQTEPGEVVASPEAWALVADRCTGVWLPTGAVRAEMVRWPLSPIPLEAAAALGEGEAALRAFIPGAILARLAAGQSAWLAELRRVTVLFAHLPGFGDDLPLELLQPVMRSLQAALYRHEGSINKLSVDDKGVNLVAALGLPPLAHEDDALRGVNAALAVQAALRGFGLSSSIGVAAGQVFCGAIGGDTRREYTLVGSAVNLAARLMQAAGPDGILCDENVRQAASGRMGFLALPPLMIKGRAAPVAAFVPAGAVSGEKRMQTPLVGR
ncbi:MAG: adenylate/guanylate cyclase domain-containing protein, partial [Chloroflexi bacterium]|nr:adenylate/guanylate cyclase domain-containing protein [Chloroflexota bacterium]